jgi:hypothetical protein
MTDAASIQATFRRYAALIEPAIVRPISFAPEVEDARSVQVERGVVFPMVIDGRWTDAAAGVVDRLVGSSALADLAVVDRSGHQRPVYRALLVYAWLQAYGRVYETMPRDAFGRWEEGLRAWCDRLEGELAEIEWDDVMPAGRGATAAEAVWMALALHVAGRVFVRDAWTDLAAASFGRLVRGQRASGAFLEATARDNPETHWYHELVILHAAASYAVQAEDRTVAAAVQRAGLFHLSETQPDHATAQPWGLFAFVWNEQTRTLADQILHAAQSQDPGGVGGVSLVLLADALYCLRLFL